MAERSFSSSEEQKLASDVIVKGRGFKQKKIIHSTLRGWEEENESIQEANSKLKEYTFTNKIKIILFCILSPESIS